MSISFDFEHNGAESVAIFDGHQVVVKGEFGKVTFTRNDDDIVYNAYRIEFRNGAEHIIVPLDPKDGKGYQGEMQVWLRSENDDEAILSFMIRLDYTEEKPLEVEPNLFFE